MVEWTRQLSSDTTASSDRWEQRKCCLFSDQKVIESDPVRCHLFFSSGCDINSPRQAGLKGETPDICKTLESPLHLGRIDQDVPLSSHVPILASQWGLERVVSTLIEHHAEINKKVLSLSTIVADSRQCSVLGCGSEYSSPCRHHQPTYRYYQSIDSCP